MYTQIIFNVCISHACIKNETHLRNPICVYLTKNDQYVITITNEVSIFAPHAPENKLFGPQIDASSQRTRTQALQPPVSSRI